MKIKSYKDLIVWQKSIKLVVFVYRITAKFPKEEKYGLTSQSRRSAVGLPSNIVEGFGRRYLGEYIQFLYISLSSLFELQTQLIVSEKLGFYRRDERLERLMNEIERMLRVMISKLKKLKRR